MKQFDLSLCMIVKDEEEVLLDCLNSIKDFVREMIIVDTGSTDLTKEIARKMGARVVDYSWNGDFAKARNAGLEKATSKWILVLDADEIWDETNNEHLPNLLKEENIYGYYVKMFNYFGEFRDKDYNVDSVCRLFRNLPNIQFKGIIHEEVTNSIKTSFSEKHIAFSSLKIHHYGYLDEVIEKKQKNERNLEAVQRALIENPDDLYLQYALGTEFFQRGNFHCALIIYKSVIKKTSVTEGYFSDLLIKTVFCFKELNKSDQALTYINQGKIFFPDFVDLLELEAQILLDFDDYEKAEQSLERCKNRGDNSNHYTTSSSAGTSQTDYMLGIVKEKQCRWEQAKSHYAASFSYDRHFYDSLSRWANLELFFERDAARFFQQLRNRFEHLTINELLIIIMQAVRWGRSDIGMPLIEKINAMNPGNGQIQVFKAIFLAQIGDYKRAKLEFEQLAQEHTEQKFLYLWTVCYTAGEKELANLYLFKLSQTNPLFSYLYDLMAHGNTGIKISPDALNQAKNAFLMIQSRSGFIELLNLQLSVPATHSIGSLQLVSPDLIPAFHLFSIPDLQSLIAKTWQNLSVYDYSSLIIISWAALKIEEWDVAFTALKKAKNLKPKRLEHVVGYSLFLHCRLMKNTVWNLDLDCLLLSL